MATCQICGRPVQANTGKIAHHGYKRPGNGWQTSSCMGARHLPYEQSCDLIPVAIESVKQYLAKQTATLASLMSNPPESLIQQWRSKAITVDRPVGFNPLTAYRSRSPRDYVTLFDRRKSEIEQSIKHAQNDLEYLNDRLTNWVKQ